MFADIDSKVLKHSVVESVELHGQDWEMVSADVDLPPEECRTTFNILSKEAKQSEALYKKKIKGTGTYVAVA